MFAHPVAKIITSAGSVLPSSNSMPCSLKWEMALSFLSLIFPSAMSLLAPISYRSSIKEKIYMSKY